MSLLQMSVSGAAMILVITVLRALAINRLPKKTFLALWGAALVRLLVPFSLPSKMSIYSLLARKTAPVTIATQAAVLPAVTEARIVPVAPQSVPAPTPAVSLWGIVWVVGTVLCAAVFAVAYWKCYREFQMSFPVENEVSRRWLQAHPLRRSISIRQTDRVSSPLTFGILHPVILMPKKTDWEDEPALQYVLDHEFTHIRRFDAVSKLLLIGAVCVHWFNPLVWAMYVLANRDMELVCDETVIRHFGSGTKASYAGVLIHMEEVRSGFAPLGSHFSKNAIEERITAIMKTRKVSVFSLAAAAVLIAGTVTVFATSAQPGANDDDMPQKNQSANESPIGTATIDGTLTSYIGNDRKTYYLIDDGNATKALNAEEFEQQYPTSDIEWWTYEEYKAWLENEKVQLQSMIGEKAWTGGRGEFVWTQEIVDETIAMYEDILEDIKNGMMYSKTVDGETNMMVGYEPSDTSTTYGYQLFIKVDNGDEKFFGPYETAGELLAEVKPFCEEQVKLGNMQQSEADEIISRYE